MMLDDVVECSALNCMNSNEKYYCYCCCCCCQIPFGHLYPVHSATNFHIPGVSKPLCPALLPRQCCCCAFLISLTSPKHTHVNPRKPTQPTHIHIKDTRQDNAGYRGRRLLEGGRYLSTPRRNVCIPSNGIINIGQFQIQL